MQWVELWFRAFVATLVLELLVAPFVLGRELGRLRRAGAVLLVNLATHPVVWFVIPELCRGHVSWTASVVLSEIWAVAIETWGFRVVFPELRWTRCLAAAALANAASTAIGLALRAGGAPL